MIDVIFDTLIDNGLVFAFALIGGIMLIAYFISRYLTRGHVHGSAIAIILGLVLAYVGGVQSGGENGIADVQLFAGISILGGAMMRDFAIVATAFGASMDELKRAGSIGVLSLFVGVILSFVVGVVIGLLFGYTDAISLTTIGAGAATYIAGPVTGTAIGATSEVITISIGAGIVKSVLTMSATPFIAKYIGLNNPRSAIVFGGLLGTTSGVAGGLAATDPKLVPYGALTATFYTGLGCLLGPSVLFLIMGMIFSM
ncbi:malonate transporter MadM subunit [Geomicrobium halophilum]|uniref:Malonate transporter MadM subunit n=1 Tax=Geomicrobium halophilum TaxID=549000 RepID=A0A841Q005_9BACL|nr:malonate transporter subunit MadM [Geomicrobium halophilum]MBB6450773.1 malonate transporter MadM subunit [Geomicrobium halophilum]